MVDRGIAQLVAEAFSLPSWAPKAAKNLAFALIAFTAIFMQPAFAKGVTIFAEPEAEQIMERMQPFINGLVSDSASVAHIPEGGTDD